MAMTQEGGTSEAARADLFALVSVRCLAPGNMFSRNHVIRAALRGAADAEWRDTAVRALAIARRSLPAPVPDRNADGIAAENEPPVTLASAFARTAVAFQALAGVDAGWWQGEGPDADGISHAFYECKSRDAGIAIAKAVSILFDHATVKGAPAASDRIAPLIERVAVHAKLLKHVMAAGAAERLGIPWSLAASTGYPTVALGHGKYRRLFWRHMTPDTSEVGTMLAQSKPLTAEVLHRAGLPVSPHRVVTGAGAAIEAARALGWPVVVKPTHSGRGTAVTTHINDEETLASAFKEASQHGTVLIEKHVEGESYRVLVYKGRCISVTRDTPARVIGDGVNSIAELVARTNATRSDRLTADWKKIKIDEAALAVLRRQELGVADVPLAGQIVYLRLHSNLSAGGTAENVTAAFHPDNKRLAITAANLLEIDLAGVDMIVPDGTRSYHEVGGRIIEVNTNPGFEMGEADHVIDDLVIAGFFPAPARGRIPTIAIMGRDGAGEFTWPADFFGDGLDPCAVVDRNGVKVGSAVVAAGDAGLAQRCGQALSDPAAAAAVFVFTPHEFATQGLGIDRLTMALAAPPWNDQFERSFAGLAALADCVIIPRHWAASYRALHGDSRGLWLVDPHMRATAGTHNEVAWRASDWTILIRRQGDSDLAIALGVDLKPQDIEIMLARAAVGLALNIPVARLRHALLACRNDDHQRLPR